MKSLKYSNIGFRSRYGKKDIKEGNLAGQSFDNDPVKRYRREAILPGQYWVKDIVISPPPGIGGYHFFFFFFSSFFLSAGSRHTPRSALAEGYRNIPAPRRNKSFFFFFFFSLGGWSSYSPVSTGGRIS